MEQSPAKSKSQWIQLIVGTLLSVGILVYILRGVSMKDLFQAFRSFNWWWSIPFLGVNFVSLWLRALRWKYFMKPTREFTTARLFSPMMIGFALNSLLPLRAGEFARAAVLGIKERISFAPIFATIVVERIFDSVTLLIMLTVVFATINLDDSASLSAGGHTITGKSIKAVSTTIAAGLFVMLAGSVFLIIGRTREYIRLLIERLPYAPRGVRIKISGFAMKFAEGLGSLRSFQSTVIVMGLSAMVWVTIAWTYQIAAWGFPGMKMSFMQSVAVTVIACLAIALPAAPGFWGLFELGIVFALGILGVEKDQSKATAYALLVHSFQYFPIVFIGLWYLWREQVSIGDLRKNPTYEAPAS